MILAKPGACQGPPQHATIKYATETKSLVTESGSLAFGPELAGCRTDSLLNVYYKFEETYIHSV